MSTLCVYGYFQKGEWKNLRSSSDNVALASKIFMDKNCLKKNVIACCNLHVSKKVIDILDLQLDGSYFSRTKEQCPFPLNVFLLVP